MLAAPTEADRAAICLQPLRESACKRYQIVHNALETPCGRASDKPAAALMACSCPLLVLIALAIAAHSSHLRRARRTLRIIRMLKRFITCTKTAIEGQVANQNAAGMRRTFLASNTAA